MLNIKLPPDALAWVKIAETHQSMVMVQTCSNHRQSDCPNCGGWRFIVMTKTVAGPFQSPPGGKGTVCKYIDGSWYAVESQSFPCPVCVDRDSLIAHYWDDSGLLENERAWRVDFLEGEPGKTNGLDAIKALLFTLPAPTGWVLLYGSYGVGKSGLLKSLVAASIRAGTRARYLRAGDLLGEIRATYSDDETIDEQDVRARYGNVPVLALDEIDRISDTGWARSTLFAILDERHRRMDQGITAMATNADPGNWPGFEYLVSRLHSGEMVAMTGKDMRE